MSVASIALAGLLNILTCTTAQGAPTYQCTVSNPQTWSYATIEDLNDCATTADSLMAVGIRASCEVVLMDSEQDADPVALPTSLSVVRM